MRRGLRAIVISVLGLLALPASGLAGVLVVRASRLPAGRSVSSLRVVRADNAAIAAVPGLRARMSVGVADGVYVVLANAVAGSRNAPVEASGGAVARRGHPARVSLRLRRSVPGIASVSSARVAAPAPAAAAGAGAPVITARGIVLAGAAGSGQPDIDLDGPIDGYLWEALHADGVRVVDETAQASAASLREQLLSEEGRLATKFVYNPLSPDFFVLGDGTISRSGKVGMQLRLVDSTGAIVAIANASGSGKNLREIVTRAVKNLAEQARGKLKPGNPAPHDCESAATPGCYAVQLTVEGLFDETGGWGSGTVSGPDGHGSVSEGFDSVEHGYVGWFAAGHPITLTATPSRGSHFDHWAGSCTGSAPACTLAPKPDLDVTGYFAEDLWTLAVDNQNASGGEAAGNEIGCGVREHTCSRIVAGQTSDADLFNLYIYPEGSYMVSHLDGCEKFDGSFEEGGDCEVAMTSNKTVTVDFACNPNATSPCSGTGAAGDVRRARRARGA